MSLVTLLRWIATRAIFLCFVSVFFFFFCTLCGHFKWYFFIAAVLISWWRKNLLVSKQPAKQTPTLILFYHSIILLIFKLFFASMFSGLVALVISIACLMHAQCTKQEKTCWYTLSFTFEQSRWKRLFLSVSVSALFFIVKYLSCSCSVSHTFTRGMVTPSSNNHDGYFFLWKPDQILARILWFTINLSHDGYFLLWKLDQILARILSYTCLSAPHNCSDAFPTRTPPALTGRKERGGWGRGGGGWAAVMKDRDSVALNARGGRTRAYVSGTSCP